MCFGSVGISGAQGESTRGPGLIGWQANGGESATGFRSDLDKIHALGRLAGGPKAAAQFSKLTASFLLCSEKSPDLRNSETIWPFFILRG